MYFLHFRFPFLQQNFYFLIIFFEFWIFKFRIENNFENLKNGRVEIKIGMVKEEFAIIKLHVNQIVFYYKWAQLLQKSLISDLNVFNYL